MKPIFLNFTDENGEKTKTFTVCSLKTKMIDNIFDLAEKADEMEKGKLGLKEIKSFFDDLRAIVVEVFKGQFTFDELNENVETEELLSVFNAICSNIGGSLRKN